VREFEWLRSARVKYGPEVRVLDISAGGLSVETRQALKPHSNVVFELTGSSAKLLLPARVLRSQIVSLKGVAIYRSACRFKTAIELSRLRSDLSGVHTAAVDSSELDFALPRLLEQCRALLDPDDVILSLESLLIEASSRTDPMAHVLAALVSPVVAVLKQRQPTDSLLAELEALHHPTGSPNPVQGTAAPAFPGDPRVRRFAGYLIDLLQEWNRLAGKRPAPENAQTDETSSRTLVPDLAPSWQKVVVRYRDGRILRGYTRDFNVVRPQFHFSPDPAAGDSLVVPLTQLKALFFVRDFAGDPAYKAQHVFTAPRHGRPLEVTFDDGEVLLGSTLNYQPDAHGFVVHPADTNGNNIRVFVSSAAVRHVRFISRPGELRRPAANETPREDQVDTSAALVNEATRQAPIDMTGTRRAPRYKVAEGTEVQIDGEMATLVNLSLVGAYVSSRVALKQKQRISVVFADQGESIHVRSVVASVSTNSADGTTRYLAGIEFLDADQLAMQRLIDRKRK
jgi:hypothetical protein